MIQEKKIGIKRAEVFLKWKRKFRREDSVK